MQIQISWPTDLDLHCLQRQDISGFRKTRVKTPQQFPYRAFQGGSSVALLLFFLRLCFHLWNYFITYLYLISLLCASVEDDWMRGGALCFVIVRCFRDSFIFYHENVFCVYLLESPYKGDFNEYTQHTIIL